MSAKPMLAAPFDYAPSPYGGLELPMPSGRGGQGSPGRKPESSPHDQPPTLRETLLPEPEPPPMRITTAIHSDSRIDVSTQLISLEPGLFTIRIVAPREIRTEGGLVLPCMRLDPLPAGAGERAYLAALSETALLTPSAPPAYLRIAGGRTAMLLTTYKASGPMPPPEIHIDIVEPRGASAPLSRSSGGKAPYPSQDVRAAPPDDTVPAAGPRPLPSAPLTLLVHLQNEGDLQFGGGAWAPAPGNEAAIEGFAVTLGADLPRNAIEYQAILGQDWFSPWMEEGEFCGSRQMALPLLGVLIRLRGPAADSHVCQVWGRFNGIEHGPFEDGIPCKADGVPMTGLRLALQPRALAPAPMAAGIAAAVRPRVRRKWV